MYACECMCVCMCVFVHIYMCVCVHVFVCVYVFMCVCVCMCVYPASYPIDALPLSEPPTVEVVKHAEYEHTTDVTPEIFIDPGKAPLSTDVTPELKEKATGRYCTSGEVVGGTIRCWQKGLGGVLQLRSTSLSFHINKISEHTAAESQFARRMYANMLIDNFSR
eukprot:GHVU01069213.1.p1 GENE.GHVU01069213.1~~GHVU01069213.1.p1  ORF type:complete len:164 (+),score=4.39 GHVU01069213.1:44-535(+)